jgi:hypothetical protein
MQRQQQISISIIARADPEYLMVNSFAALKSSHCRCLSSSFQT